MSIIEREQQEQESGSATPRPQIILSQKDYAPQPYKPGVWEVVGEGSLGTQFSALEVAVVESDLRTTDPLFTDFDASSASERKTSILHSQDGTSAHPVLNVGAGVSEEMMQQIKDEAFAAGKEAGYAEGFQAGEGQANAQQVALAAQLHEFLTALKQQQQAQAVRMEQEGVRLALAVSKKILLTTAQVKPEYIVDVLRQAVEMLGVNKPIRIRLSPDDLEFIRVIGLPSDLSKEEIGAEFVADEKIQSGCVVENNFGEIDLELERMWEQVRETIYEVTK